MAFCTANVVAEIPIAILGGVIYWALWYWPTGLPADGSTSGYVFLMTVLFFLFQASWGQWICAFAPSFTVISNVFPFFFVMFSLFNGAVRPYSQLSVFWKYWMYYLNPSTYWIGGVLAATVGGVSVVCAAGEAAVLVPPPGESCLQYAGAWLESMNGGMGSGYLINPNAMTACEYCPYKSGAEYLATVNIFPGDKWRDLGIFAAFCVSNWALVYFFIYTVRIQGWTFGFGPLFGFLGGLVEGVKGVFRRGRGCGVAKGVEK